MRYKYLFILFIISSFSTACTTVNVWERDVLSKREMSWQVSPMESDFKSHVYSAKEGSSGGGQAAGGGCGCN
ncbi:MAG: DUF4266 domain-containing protein [Pseudomonadales bacterium]|nr:DUF4266 domain-containing protein [Pseudomonadales bacterium]